MKSVGLAGLLFFAVTSMVPAQSLLRAPAYAASSRVPVAGSPFWAHGDFAINSYTGTNNSPGTQCPCIGLNGYGFSGSFGVLPQLSIVAEGDYLHSRNALQQNQSLTLGTYMGGARYNLPFQVGLMQNRAHLFVQGMLGGEHAGGSMAGVADHTFAFATRIGGGFDVPMIHGMTIRMLQVDYLRSNFHNGGTNSQNNVLLSFGISHSWGGVPYGGRSF